MGHAVVNHTVFIDECGYNIWTARSQGRALRGERAYRQVCGQRGRNVTVALAISPTSGLVFHSAILRGMNGQRFDDFLAQTRLNLNPDEHVIFIYDGAPAHRNPAIPRTNSELRKLQPYSPFLNIVEQAVSALEAAIKVDISRPEIQVQVNNCTEARRQGLALGRSCYFKHYRGILVPSLLPNVDKGSGLCRRSFQDASITKQPKDNSLKLRNNFESLFPLYCLSLLHKCLTIRRIECNFSINDCLLVPLIVPLYANCLIECLRRC